CTPTAALIRASRSTPIWPSTTGFSLLARIDLWDRSVVRCKQRPGQMDGLDRHRVRFRRVKDHVDTHRKQAHQVISAQARPLRGAGEQRHPLGSAEDADPPLTVIE